MLRNPAIVIEGIRCCTQMSGSKCKLCPYRNMEDCTRYLGRDAMEHLKPLEDSPHPKIDGRTWDHCGHCDEILFRSYTFCPNCGRRIGWID